jgi:hypothetical protein
MRRKKHVRTCRDPVSNPAHAKGHAPPKHSGVLLLARRFCGGAPRRDGGRMVSRWTSALPIAGEYRRAASGPGTARPVETMRAGIERASTLGARKSQPARMPVTTTKPSPTGPGCSGVDTRSGPGREGDDASSHPERDELTGASLTQVHGVAVISRLAHRPAVFLNEVGCLSARFHGLGPPFASCADRRKMDTPFWGRESRERPL